jgi:HEPN domain-containing protein
MKPLEQVKRELTRGWLDKAEVDLKTCRHLLTGGRDYAEAIAFHAEQAAEKYLKGLLVWRQVEFTKTHDIGRLLELVSTFDESLAARLSRARHLTPYGVEYRYPGDYPEVSLAEAEDCLDIATLVRGEVLRQLAPDILD